MEVEPFLDSDDKSFDTSISSEVDNTDSSNDVDITKHENVPSVNEDSDNNYESVNFTDAAPAQSNSNTKFMRHCDIDNFPKNVTISRGQDN